jgi:ribonuclease P protein component
MLAADYRFHGHRSLSFLLHRGRTIRGEHIGLKFIQNNRRQESRCAVVVARKVTKRAPVRNRIRRRIYELIRAEWPTIAKGYDFAFFVYDQEIASLEHNALKEQIDSLLERANMYVDDL